MRSWQSTDATGKGERRSQYLMVLSQEPVQSMGPALLGISTKRTQRMGCSWAATWTAFELLEPRSSIRAALSAPAPTIFVPSCGTS